MTLIEAIKSGKRFRRHVAGGRVPLEWLELDQREVFSVEELLADDWEVEEEKIELTKGQIWAAVSFALRSNHVQAVGLDQIIFKELGFKS